MNQTHIASDKLADLLHTPIVTIILQEFMRVEELLKRVRNLSILHLKDRTYARVEPAHIAVSIYMD